MRRLIIAVVLMAVAGGVAWFARSRPEPPADARRVVVVAAAADLQFALADVVTAFERLRPDIAVNVTYGSSGHFLAQLSQGAPFDLFLSADVSYPRQLVEQGRAVPDSTFVYAVGRLVVWVPNDSPLDVNALGIRAMLDPGVRKVAIANPKHAPYGRAAEAALKHAAVYDRVKGRLVYGENIAQAAQFVETGAADVGIIALSLALSPTMRDRGRYWPVPADAYPRLEQGGCVLTGANDKDA